MTRVRMTGILAIAAAAFAGPAFGQMQKAPAPPSNASPAMTSTPLASFAREAAAGGLAEVELGNLAVQKATDPAVKAFGQQMIDDHSKANADLQALAAQAGVTLPAQVDPKAKKTMAKLSALSGAAFDKAYMDDMVKDHKEDIALFEKASRASGDSPFKTFAAEKLPTLREHLQMAERAQAGLGKSGGSSSGSNR